MDLCAGLSFWHTDPFGQPMFLYILYASVGAFLCVTMHYVDVLLHVTANGMIEVRHIVYIWLLNEKISYLASIICIPLPLQFSLLIMQGYYKS